METSNSNQNSNRFLLLLLLCFSFVVLIYTNSINLILNCIMNYLVIRLMIFNKQIKNENSKLYNSNVPSWPIAAIVFSRTRIRLGDPSFLYSDQFILYSLIKIQDTKFR